MSTDKSQDKPGPMGWGLEEDKIQDTLYKEKKNFDQLAANKPKALMRTKAKAFNNKTMELVKAEMAKDGIEGGFSCRYVEKVIFKEFFQWKAQLIGSCVASGAMRIMARRALIEVFLLMATEDIVGTQITGTNNVAFFAPYSYRAGRKKGGINGNGDGSFCSAHIEGALDFGMLTCNTPGLESDDFPEPQNTRLYKQWGANDTLLNKFASEGRKVKLLESEKITNIDSHWTALVEHYKPQMVCSNWAFKPKSQHPTWKLANGDPVWMYTRNKRSSWAHNMSLDGAITHGGNKYTLIENSWGINAHKNGSFFILEADETANWIRDAEIQTIGDIDLPDSEHPV